MAIGLIIGVCVSVLNTRLLGPQQYGDLKFLQTLFTFVVTSLTFGFFVSGSRLIALKEHEKIKKEIIGNLLILAAFISAVMIIGLFIFSYFEEQLFSNNLGKIIRIFSPLLFVYPFRLCLENIMQGDNRIYELSVFRLCPQILYLITAVMFNYFIPLKLSSALFIQLVTLAAIILFMLISLKPKFANFKKNKIIILKENKKYGFPVYIGILSGVLTSHLGGLTIAFFIDNINVGFFSLALTITMPLTMIPSAVGTTFFKDFADKNFIPKKASIVTFALSISALLLFLLLIKHVVLLLYSKEFLSVVPLTYIISTGSVFHGFGDYINRFLGAHGKGKALRNGAIAVGLSNIFGYFVLVYKFGINGAAITKLISGIIYLSMMYCYYSKFTKRVIYIEQKT